MRTSSAYQEEATYLSVRTQETVFLQPRKMSGVLGGDSGTDPQKLEGRKDEESKPREFFWDSVSLYVVGVIIALAAIDVITEFIRGSAVSCFSPPGQTITEAQENYINSFCSASLPITEYFPVFIVVHAILIAIPHYLWLNHYGGNFEFFFAQVKEMDRIRCEETGTYSEKNRIIIQQLTQAFTTYKQNWMFILYVMKLILQLVFTLAGFLAAIIAFTDFKETFMCPRNPNLTDLFWPFESQVRCVFTSLRLLSAVRLADLILLALLSLSLIWSLIWCASTHPTELSTNETALFCFQSSMAPEHYVPKFPFKGCLHPIKRCLLKCFPSTSVIGRGPRIQTNLDFLVLRLFRTDSGLGFVFRELQILEKIRHHNDDDQRRANLHKRQQQAKTLGDGDLIQPRDVKGYRGDLKWSFTKKPGEKGMFDKNFERLQSTEPLILPDSIRGAMIGLASIAPKNKLALFLNFGSVSLGIPTALSRVFIKVGVINFNPYFKQSESAALPFETKAFASDIVEVKYPENVLSSEIERANDFPKGLEEIWGVTNDTADLIMVGPVDNEMYISTISLFLAKIAKIPQQPKTRFSQGCLLVTLYPREIAAKQTGSEFHPYKPPHKFFEEFTQKICVDKEANNLEWPPRASAAEPEGTVESPCDLSLLCGDSYSTFTVGLYRYPPQQGQTPGQAVGMAKGSPQGRSGAGYTAISFSDGKEGGIHETTQSDRPQDLNKVSYAEINLTPQHV